MSNESIYTLAVHAGEDREANHGALSIPIYNASVYAFTDAEDGAAIHNEFKHGYYYGRLGNPTTEALERTIAELESAEAGLSFASGMAAVSAAILPNVRSGDHIIAPESMYSTTTNFLHHLADSLKIETTFIDAPTKHQDPVDRIAVEPSAQDHRYSERSRNCEICRRLNDRR